MNALTLCALIIDRMSRAVQLFVINKISNRVTFHAFAIWSILSLPSILPWASVNFGMHSLLSFVPFGIILIAAWKAQTSKHYVVVGLLAGLSIWASYVNLIMLPALAILLFLHGTNWRNYASVFATCAAVILVHVGVRNFADAGFHLADFSSTGIRDLDYNYLTDLETYKHLYQVFIEALPGPSLLPKIFGIDPSSVRTAWNLFLAIGAASTLISLILKRSIPILIAVIEGSIFLLGYAISTFYDPHIDRSHYVYARHLTYILPLLSFLAIYGLSRLRFSTVLLSFFIGLGAIGSISSMSRQLSQDPSNPEAGWVLGTKLGHDPARLVRIEDPQHLRSGALMEGMGWSIDSTIIGSSRAQSDGLTEFQKIRSEIPDRYLSSFNEGVKHAFSEGMRPKLDQSFQSLILETDTRE